MVSWSPSQLVQDFVHQRYLGFEAFETSGWLQHRAQRRLRHPYVGWANEGSFSLWRELRGVQAPVQNAWFMLSRQRMKKLFWLFVFMLSFHFRETFEKQPGILFPDGLSDRRIQHIHTQPGPVERLCGAFGISCPELQGWIGNQFFKKKVMRIASSTWKSVSAKWIWDYIVLTVQPGYFGPKMKVSQILKD